MTVLAVIASFLAISVTILLFSVGKFIDVLIFPRNFLYFFMLSSYVGDLQVNIRDLKAREDYIDKIILEAERKSRSPVAQVDGWKRDIAAIIPEISNCLVDYWKCKNDSGLISFIRSHYWVGIRCADYLEKVKDLLKRGSFDEVTMESDSNYPIPTTYEVPGSMKLKYRMALEFVRYDNSTNVIGLWGMGGVGKTSFLKKMHNSCLRLPIFDHVIWITASREQSTISKIQSEIVKKLRLTESGDIQSQACIIQNFLGNKDFLLFIDDLWEDVDLIEVGVPDTNDIRCDNKRKVVFTTRQQYVCGNMEAKDIIKVECLNWEESWFLFKEKVGEQVIHSHPDISELAKDVAKECKGLPLALITIGRAMSTKRCSYEWKLALTLMRTSQVQDVSGTKIHKILEISYDFLDNEILKKCFLSISMWPEDYSITPYEVVQCWIGLDIIANFESMEEAYQLGYSYIRRLQAACLLEFAEEYVSICVNEIVKMHDVLRDLALWIVSDRGENKNKWMINAGIQLQEATNIEVKWSEAERISLMDNRIKVLPSVIPGCPKLLILILSKNMLQCESILYCFHHFHCLTYLDLSNNRFDSFPESICDLTKLRYLNMSSNYIRDLPMKLRNLKRLKYLWLRDNNITNVPSGAFAELEKLLVLDMFQATQCGNSFVDFKELKSIEKKLLYFGITVEGKEKLSELMLLSDIRLEALCIRDLQNTYFHFMSIMRNSRWLKELLIEFDGLSEIVFDNNEIHCDIPLNLEILRLYSLYNLRTIIWNEIKPERLFVKLQEIVIFKCEHLEDVTWAIHLPSLKLLHITLCERMRIAINNDVVTVDPHVLTFPSLENLLVSSMHNLEKMSTSSLAFPQLKIMQVDDCDKLKTLPLDVSKTPKLTRIEGQVEWWENLEWEDDNSRPHFNQFFFDREQWLN